MIEFRITMAYMFGMLFISACSTLPIDTLNKRIAAFEISYEQVLITVTKWNDEHRLNVIELEKIKKLVSDIRQARLAVYIAKNAGDIQDAQSKLSLATASLQVIRDYIVEQEKLQQRMEYIIPDDGKFQWYLASLRRSEYIQ